MNAATIYGNKHITDNLNIMLLSGRIPHATLIYGERGLGKKTLACYIAAKIVSPEKEVNPYAHPDIIWAEHSGKLNGFSVASLKELCADAYVLPNNSDKKVYIFDECDKMSIAAQNTLLKIIEEPPKFAVFIFITASREVFLPTILSRVISFGMSECTILECHDALASEGYNNEEEIQNALLSFGGNIGLCKEYLDGGSIKSCAESVRIIADCLADRDEYGLLKAFNLIESDKGKTVLILNMLDKVIRDAAVIGIECKNIGCYPIGAEKIQNIYSVKKLEKIHDIIYNTIHQLNTNVNMSIEMSSVCGQLLDI